MGSGRLVEFADHFPHATSYSAVAGRSGLCACVSDKDQLLSMIGRYFRAAVSQGAVSAFHFALNIALVRLIEPSEYGLFALVFAGALIIASASNALFTVPLSVLRPGVDEHEKLALDRDLNTPTIVFGVVVAVATVIVALAFSGTGGLAVAVAAAAFVSTFTTRMHARGAGYARFAAAEVLRADLVYVVVGAVGVAAAFGPVDTERSAWVVLTILSIANVLSCSAMIPVESIGRIFDRSLPRRYGQYWVHARWALLGALATMLASQGHGLIIGAVLDPAAFAPVAAGFVLFGPVRILFSTIQNVLRPEMARSLSEGNVRSANRQAILATGSTVLVVVLVGGVIALAWEEIFARLYADRYEDEPMSRIVTFWAIVTLIGATRTGTNALLQALKRFAPLSLVGVAGALVSMSLVLAIALVGEVSATILGVAAGELTMTIFTLWLASGRRLSSTSTKVAPGLR